MIIIIINYSGVAGEQTVLGSELGGASTHFLQSFKNMFLAEI